MTKRKVFMAFESKDEQQCAHLAAWLSKVSKQAKCTVKKRPRIDGIHYQVNLRYAANIRPVTMFRIGQLFAEYVGLTSYKAFKLLPQPAVEKFVDFHETTPKQ